MAFSIQADIEVDTQDIGDETIEQPSKRSPFSFDTHVDVISSTEIDKGFYKKDKVNYAESIAELGMIVCYNEEYTEGVLAAVAFNPTYLKWHGNPWFEHDHFNMANFTVSAFTKRADRWFWRAQLTAAFDVDNWSTKYTLYDITLWGRYELCNGVGVHIGFLGETGVQLDRVYPIVGFDWEISKKLKLSLVFPVNISLLYSVNSCWSLGASGRFFNSRFRVPDSEVSHKPLVRYTNFGAEFIVAYKRDYISANIHIGSTVGGIYRVANSRNRHADNYHLAPSAYAGAEVDMKF